MKRTLLKYACSALLFALPVFKLSAQDATTVQPAADPYFFDRFLAALIMGIAAVVAVTAIFVLYRLLSIMIKVQQVRIYHEQGMDAYLAEVKTPQKSLWQKFRERMDRRVPAEKEEEIMFEHSFDGIRELDNVLPPWWVYLFYITIFWGVGYYIYYHVGGGGPSSQEEYKMEMEAAEKAVAEYRASQSDLVNESTVTLLEDANSLSAGEATYKSLCVSCHGPEGQGMQGLGPNFTDDAWLHGCTIKDVFSTVKYGVPQTAMVSWQSQLRPADIQKVASYILSLRGTNPPNPKAPEGQPCQPGEEKAPAKPTTEGGQMGMNQ